MLLSGSTELLMAYAMFYCILYLFVCTYAGKELLSQLITTAASGRNLPSHVMHMQANQKIFIFQYFSFYKQSKFHAHLSWTWTKLYNLDAWYCSVRVSRKFCQRGSNSGNVFFLVGVGRGVQISLKAGHHRPAIETRSLLCRSNLECLLGSLLIFMGSVPVLLKKPIFLRFFRVGVRVPSPSPWIRAGALCYRSTSEMVVWVVVWSKQSMLWVQHLYSCKWTHCILSV